MAEAELKELVTKMVQSSDQQQAQIVLQQQQITGLIEALQNMPGVAQPVAVQVNQAQLAPEIVRAEKVQRLAMNIRKTNRLKEFWHTKDADIRVYLKKFDEEVKSLKVMVGIQNELERDEYVPLLRGSLDYNVIKRLEQVFLADPNNIVTWENVSIENIHKLLIKEFGVRYTDVANVLQQFGPSRLSKSSEKTVSEHYFEWYSQIPEVMKPSTNDENKSFVDLIHRAMYYISLNDSFLQQALADLKEAAPTLKSYVDESIAAESRR